MRPLVLGHPLNDSPESFKEWVRIALQEIENASYEDIAEVADAYTITGTLTETRELNVTTPTAANVANVLATLITDIQRRGSKRDLS